MQEKGRLSMIIHSTWCEKAKIDGYGEFCNIIKSEKYVVGNVYGNLWQTRKSIP